MMKEFKVTGRRLFPYVLIIPSIVILGILVVYPLIFSFTMAVSKIDLMRMQITRFVGLGNFIKMISDFRFWNGLKITLFFTVLAVGIEFFAGLGVALCFFKATIDGYRRLVQLERLLFVLPVMMTPIVIGITWKFMFNMDQGIINYLIGQVGLESQNWVGGEPLAFLCVVAVDVWQWTPFCFLIMLSALYTLPKAPYEAASIEGASAWHSFRYITLPLLKSTIGVILLIRIMDAIKVFDYLYVLTGGGPGISTEVLNWYIYVVSFKHLDLGYGAAMVIVTLFLITGISVVLLRTLKVRL